MKKNDAATLNGDVYRVQGLVVLSMSKKSGAKPQLTVEEARAAIADAIRSGSVEVEARTFKTGSSGFYMRGNRVRLGAGAGAE